MEDGIYTRKPVEYESMFVNMILMAACIEIHHGCSSTIEAIVIITKNTFL